MAERERIDARSVACRFRSGNGVPCGARPGDPCRNVQGLAVEWHHSVRYMDGIRREDPRGTDGHQASAGL